MDNATEALCDRLASEFERLGAAGTLGRVVGYLMVQSAPVPLREIASDFGISRATASIMMRSASTAQFAERVTRPGDRQDYYRVIPRWWESTTEAKLRSFYVWMAFIGEYRRTATEIPPDVDARLRDMTDFLAFVEERFSNLGDEFEKWRREREEGTSDGTAGG